MTQRINVVVPTRERADTLFYCLKTIVAQDIDNLSIIVADNASSPATREAVDSINDPRIIYRNTGERLSMSHNYEFALSTITEGWIVMVGDDDGLLPHRLGTQIEELEASGLQAIATETCFYNWPGAALDIPARLTVPLDEKTVVVKARDGVARMLLSERHDIRLPQTYTGGIVHSDVFNRIKAKKGSFYQSQIPDIFSGYAIASNIDSFIYTRKPFAIAGRSSHSTGASLFSLKKTAFLEENLIPFHDDFPLPPVGTLAFSMPAMIYECYTQAGYLHNGNPPISKQEMLVRILALTRHGREHIMPWGQQFAAQHGLDLDAALREAPIVRRAAKRRDVGRQISSLWNTARVFQDDPRPIANVYEAACTADAILRDPPLRVTNAVDSLMRRFHKQTRVP